MNPTVDSERLKIILEKLNVDPHRLTLSLDYKIPSVIYNILKGKGTMDAEFIEFFIKKYPQVNFLYLKEGKGKPILSVSEAISQRSILGLSNDELRIESEESINQHLSIVERRLNVIEGLLVKQQQENQVTKEED